MTVATANDLTVDAFEAIARTVPYRPKGIFYSEMFLFVRACFDAGVKLVMESGVLNGVSTRLLAAVNPWPVISIDRSKSALAWEPPAGVQFVQGDANVVLPNLLSLTRAVPIGVLIDGPKGAEALALKDECLTYTAVKVVAIHGIGRGHDETLHTWDDDYYEADRLDWLVSHEFKQAYPCGPGLAVWVRH